jgi:hypothetical protein
MKFTFTSIVAILGTIRLTAQTITSTSSSLVAQPIPDRTITYSVSGAGTSKTVAFGLDLAWLSEANVRRGIAFMGRPRVKLIRSSFQPIDSLVNGDLDSTELATLNERLRIISTWMGTTQISLNDDDPSISSWYKNADGTTNATRWAQLIDVVTRHHQDAGDTVITASPFNEPDYSTSQGSMQDFYNICSVLHTNSRFNSIRLSGGNTLNCDVALNWYNFLKPVISEGNTHQLAGSFDNFANFYQTVRADGNHATGDEMHNVMEAMVGAQYGMQTGIWWGTAELARGEFCKASDGVQLGYAEHRPNWTAASVYRGPTGKVQAFGGTSERQAVTTTYRFVSNDKDVYYDGYGPTREYTMVLPGGAGYQNGQTNAERVVNITWGEDIQPSINGRYTLVNRSTGKVLEVPGGSTTNGSFLQVNSDNGQAWQQWNVIPVNSRIGGDFSYFTIGNVNSAKSIDVYNWSLDNGGNIDAWDSAAGANQQWYFDYAGDGWFYIRSRQSAKCIEVTADGLNTDQWDVTGSANQQWRLLPVSASVEFTAPSAPGGLTAVAQNESVKLTWSASTASDLAGYSVFRAASTGDAYNTIARNITTTSFVDNTATSGSTYYYKIKAVDQSLNRSAYSSEVSATPSGSKGLVADYAFESNTYDTSANLNHSAAYGGVSFTTGKVGAKAVSLNGTDAFVQMPATIANHRTITIAAWVYWNGGAAWQRIFDFGNDQMQNMFLTPNSGSGTLRFAIKNGGGEQILDAPVLPTGVWSHVAVILDSTGGSMYVNGTLVAQSGSITIRPSDFQPVSNYIGRSQYPDPLLNGRIDEFRVYNYALTASQIGQLAGVATSMHVQFINLGSAAAPQGKKRGTARIAIYNDLGSAVSNATVTGNFTGTFNESASGATASDGTVTLQTTGTSKSIATLTFCVTNVTHATLTYNSAQNVVTCDTGSNLRTAQPNSTQGGLQSAFVYPNPASKVVNIELEFVSPSTEARILSLSGQIIKRVVLAALDNKVQISELPAGLYILEVTTGPETIRSKFIKE